MTPKQAVAFVERHGVVLQSARGPVPSLAETVAGGPIRGSWWGHAKGKEIFRAASAVCDDPDVLVCRLIDDKITYVHRRLWPALVKLAGRFRKNRLARVSEAHTPSGAHRSTSTPFPEWVPSEVMVEVGAMSVAAAEGVLAPWPALRGTARVRKAAK